MQETKKKAIETCLAAILVMMLPGTVYAAEIPSLPAEPQQEDVISIACPLIGEAETSPFHFSLDPQGLVYETNAMRYGGGIVEEGASLLFHNQEGAYDFSKTSDFLAVTNYSTVPVLVTISAQIQGLGEIGLAENEDFSGSEACSLYLALTDSAGNMQPLSAEGEVSVTFELQPALEDAYVYRLDETAQSYRYELSEDADGFSFDTYSFGLTGACNTDADWENVDAHPVVTVTWHAEPVLTGGETAAHDGGMMPDEKSSGASESVSADGNQDGQDTGTPESNESVKGEISSGDRVNAPEQEEAAKGEGGNAESADAPEQEEASEGEGGNAESADAPEQEEASEGEGGNAESADAFNQEEPMEGECSSAENAGTFGQEEAGEGVAGSKENASESGLAERPAGDESSSGDTVQ